MTHTSVPSRFRRPVRLGHGLRIYPIPEFPLFIDNKVQIRATRSSVETSDSSKNNLHGFIQVNCKSLRSVHGLETQAKVIQACSPSQIKIETQSSIRIFAVKKTAPDGREKKPIQCRVDHNYVGSLSSLSDATRPFDLSPGTHLLETEHEGQDRRQAIFWIIQNAPGSDNFSAENECHPSNTVFVTYGAYPQNQVSKRISALASSAYKQGIRLHVIAVGQRYEHYQIKVVALYEFIESLPPQIRYIAAIDGRDCILVRNAEHLCRQFRHTGASILISSSRLCWPVQSSQWRTRFPKDQTRRHFISAGMFMGERCALRTALQTLRLAAKNLPPKFARWKKDDQFLWQYCWLNGHIQLTPDYEHRVFANTVCHDRSTGFNRDFELKPIIRDRMTGGEPSVIHFPGAGSKFMPRWDRHIGVLP
jgi:hypothetical protein